MRVGAVLAALALSLPLAGCLDVGPAEDADAGVPAVAGAAGDVRVTRTDAMAFRESVVDAAVGTATDLYEPTVEVSDSGVVYVAGHTVAADTTGTPAFFSRDDGTTWQPLPFAGPLRTPPPGQGSAPPPGVEGFIVAGDGGRAWMVDITLATLPVQGWCGDGAEACYHNPNAYDRAASATQPCGAVASLNDRPWAAHADGTLLLVNNPGSGVQVGVLPVPPALPTGVGGATWNLCAATGGYFPGVPDMRDDLLFAVPHFVGDVLTVVLGNAGDVSDVEVREVFEAGSVVAGGLNHGLAAFDADGTLYVAAMNNTGAGEGRFRVAASRDDGETFVQATFSVGPTVGFLYLDGNPGGPGALVTWSQAGDAPDTSDWYAGHLRVGPGGAPVLENVSLVVAGIVGSAVVDGAVGGSGDVIGSAVGPDGRAYLATFEDPGMPDYVLSNPVSVWVQEPGTATLPVRRDGTRTPQA